MGRPACRGLGAGLQGRRVGLAVPRPLVVSGEGKGSCPRRLHLRDEPRKGLELRRRFVPPLLAFGIDAAASVARRGKIDARAVDSSHIRLEWRAVAHARRYRIVRGGLLVGITRHPRNVLRMRFSGLPRAMPTASSRWARAIRGCARSRAPAPPRCFRHAAFRALSRRTASGTHRSATLPSIRGARSLGLSGRSRDEDERRTAGLWRLRGRGASERPLVRRPVPALPLLHPRRLRKVRDPRHGTTRSGGRPPSRCDQPHLAGVSGISGWDTCRAVTGRPAPAQPSR